ncbi:MAG: ROK family protein, partial [Rhodoluna sp.]|nr:ROK family protein [Rhodoluna sp.]
MGKKAIGIDIGGTGIKGALVDVKTGQLASDRIRMETPEGGRPDDIAKVVQSIVRELRADKGVAVGICFPAVVQHGVAKSAA